jgi:hypothetical protein
VKYKVEIILDVKDLHSIVVDGTWLQMDVRSQEGEILWKKHDNVIRLSVNRCRWDTLGDVDQLSNLSTHMVKINDSSWIKIQRNHVDLL